MWNKNYRQLKKGETIKEGDEVGNIGYNKDGSIDVLDSEGNPFAKLK